MLDASREWYARNILPPNAQNCPDLQYCFVSDRAVSGRSLQTHFQFHPSEGEARTLNG